MCVYIYPNVPGDAIVRLSHPRSGDNQGQETSKPANLATMAQSPQTTIPTITIRHRDLTVFLVFSAPIQFSWEPRK